MSPFIIFAIVLTLGYVIYYGAMVATDLAAQSKRQGDETETIDTGTEEDDFVHTAKSVYEDPDNGGFGFTTDVPEEPAQVIQEAEEEPEEVPEPTNEAVEEETPAEEAEEPLSEGTAEETSDEPTDTDEPEVQEDPEPEVEEDDDGLVTVEYTEQQEEKKEELFDVNQAFDPSLTQPKFGVSQVIEPSASPETQQKANEVNNALESIERLGNQHKPLVLANLLKNKELSEQHNIDTRDEVTKQ